MLIKVDEDLPAEIASMLRASGHDALTVFEQNMSGASDQDLWARIQAEERLLVTADKGFADVRAFPPDSHAGVMLLRVQRESRTAYVALLNTILEQFDFQQASRKLVVASPGAMRIYRAAEQEG